MKNGVSAVWFVGLVITFLMIFSAFIIITTDYSNSFKMKNEVLTIIEKNKGMTFLTGTEVNSTIKPSEKVLANVGAIKTINVFLAANSYAAKGSCYIPTGATVYGVKSLKYGKSDNKSSVYEVANEGESYYYCFAKYPTGRSAIDAYPSVYYSVELFYRFEIPILREFLPIRVEGVTDEIYLPASDDIVTNSNDYFSIGG